MMKIETERLYIRHFVNEDASICFEGWGDRWAFGWFYNGISNEYGSDEFFCKMLWWKITNTWVIVEKESGACIGYISFDIPYQELRIGEIGYVIGEKWHGKGYGTEAVKKDDFRILVKR